MDLDEMETEDLVAESKQLINELGRRLAWNDEYSKNWFARKDELILQQSKQITELTNKLKRLRIDIATLVRSNGLLLIEPSLGQAPTPPQEPEAELQGPIKPASAYQKDLDEAYFNGRVDGLAALGRSLQSGIGSGIKG